MHLTRRQWTSAALGVPALLRAGARIDRSWISVITDEIARSQADSIQFAQQYGLKPGDVRRASARLVAGQEVGDIHTANRTYDVQLWSIPEVRHSSVRPISNHAAYAV